MPELDGRNIAHLSRLGIDGTGQPLYEGTDPLGGMERSALVGHGTPEPTGENE